MTINGGLRTRFIVDSVYEIVTSCLADLGWLDSGRDHLPIHFTAEPLGLDEEVPLNTVAFEPGIGTDQAAEVGSSLTEDTLDFTIDVYGENRSLALELSHDIRDILRGQHPSIGRTMASIEVFDPRQATPLVAFSVVVANVKVLPPAPGWPQAWRRFWYNISFQLEDDGADVGG